MSIMDNEKVGYFGKRANMRKQRSGATKVSRERKKKVRVGK